MENAINSNRLPSLDGWRALSIILVLNYHGEMAGSHGGGAIIPLLFDGNLGVRNFFVISGFLISWLLLQEARATGKIDLRSFYLRRFLRILPVYFVFLLVLFGLQLFTPYREPAAGWLGSLTFTRNFTAGGMGSAHLWSLAVEEQFYALWPGLFALLLGRSLRAKLLWLALPIFMAPLLRVGTFVYCFEHTRALPGWLPAAPPSAWLLELVGKSSFFGQADSLAGGCLAAILLAEYQSRIASLMRQWRTGIFLAGLLLVIIPYWFPQSGFFYFFDVTCGGSLQAAGFCVLLGQSLHNPDWSVYRVLNWRWVKWIGVLSYSLYIWQQIFYFRIWSGPDFWQTHPNAAWACACVIPILAVAMLSYYGLERPLFRLRSHFRPAGGVKQRG